MACRILTVILLLSTLLAACGGCDESASKPGKPERFTVQWLDSGSYRLTIRFDGNGALVDEKTLDMTATHGETRTIVEAFTVDDWCVDIQSPVASMVPGIVITGKLYPAEVTGANWDDNGFAVLPQNSDGTAITSADIALWALTPAWWAAHPIAGTVSNPGPAIHYRTESRADGLLVTWGGVDHWFPKPTS